MLFFNQLLWSQHLITSLPEGVFSPDVEEVEDYKTGIVLYDQYTLTQKKPSVRKGEGGVPMSGKQEDYYSNGFLLHKGSYKDGVLKSFTNYYVNGSKERQFKGKHPGEGVISCYYINGYYRSIDTYENFRIIEQETYYNNGVLKTKEVRDTETLIPTLILEKNNENTIITRIEMIDPDSLIYEKEITRVDGERLAYGRMVLDTTSGEIINEGPYYTYGRNGEMTSEVLYAKGNVLSVMSDDRPEDEREYFSYETSPEVVQSDQYASGTNKHGNADKPKSGSSLIPHDFIRFDRNNDDFISNKEVDLAVSDFFEDDSISLDQINGLVNFFFEQD